MKPLFIKILTSVSIFMTLAAFSLSLYVFWADRANEVTFSYIGEANRLWYFIYCLTLVCAFCLNIAVFFIKRNINKRRVVPAVCILLGLTVIFSLLQSIIIDPAFHELHIFLAASFTGFACLALIVSVVAEIVYGSGRHGFYYLFILCMTGGMNFYAIYAYGWLIASYQWLFASAMLATSCALAHAGNKNQTASSWQH